MDGDLDASGIGHSELGGGRNEESEGDEPPDAVDADKAAPELGRIARNIRPFSQIRSHKVHRCTEKLEALFTKNQNLGSESLDRPDTSTTSDRNGASMTRLSRFEPCAARCVQREGIERDIASGSW